MAYIPLLKRENILAWIHDSYTGSDAPLDDDMPDWEDNLSIQLGEEFDIDPEDAYMLIQTYFNN